ncbi:MAG: DNA internalization-related competence protein ComEC/Rec2 [bacterium]
MNRPLFYVLISIISGILLSAYADPWTLFLVILVPVMLLVISFKRFKRFEWLLLLSVFFFLGALGQSLWMTCLPKDHILRRMDDQHKSTVTGMVVSFPEVFADRVRFLLSIERYQGMESSGMMDVSIYTSSTAKQQGTKSVDLDYGDRVKVTGTFRRPRNYKNPGAFDYAAHLKRKGIWVMGSASPGGIKVIEKRKGNPFIMRIMGYKKDFHHFLGTLFPESSTALIKALITGDRSGVSREMQERFARTGTSHLLAISGLNMWFVSFFCYQCLLLIFRYFLPLSILRKSYFWFIPFRLASMMTLILFPIYTIFVGGSTSAVRACIMIMVYLAARVLERERDLFQTLILAALAILVWRPPSLFDIDFQLSFAAVTAMVLSLQHQQTGEWEERKTHALQPGKSGFYDISRNIFEKITGLIFVTLIATTATAPITAATFHRVSQAGIVTNLLLVPLTGFWIVPCALITLVLFLIYPPLAVWPAKISGVGVTLLANGVDYFGSFTWASTWVFPPPGVLTLIYYVLFLLILIFPRMGEARRIGCILILSLLFFAASFWIGRIRGDGELHIRFLDVGQGSSILLILPHAETVLIDGGGSYLSSQDIGRQVVLPALLAMGIRKVDLMILTHPHPDHMNGLIGILEEIPVGEVWDAWEAFPSEEYRRFRKLIADKGIPRRFLNHTGERIAKGNIFFDVLHHGSGYTSGSNSSVNNDSLILKVTFGEISLLVTADLEAPGEKNLLQTYGRQGLKSTILQVPHHGSTHSSSPSFIDGVRPEMAVFQLGSNNPFQFPNSDVLGRYRYIFPEKALFRTDLNGSVWIRTDGRKVWTQCYESNFIVTRK